jgi:hypothetical protein
MSDLVEHWLASGRFARLNDMQLRPEPHPLLPNTPGRIRRGQADAYPLTSAENRAFMLKKFFGGRSLDGGYLARVQQVLPRTVGFSVGVQRTVLTRDALRLGGDVYWTQALADWLHDTVLMPRLAGGDWSAMADDLRAGRRQLSITQRRALAAALADRVWQLEAYECSHRDLTGANVFVDPSTMSVELIDFDSLYHPSLVMPAGTTCGTPGYLAPFACGANRDPRITWCAQADRFALALLCVEILVVGPGAPWSGDGGLFDQVHLVQWSGPSIAWARQQLMAAGPDACVAFDRAIASTSFAACPAPGDWLAIVGASSVRTATTAPQQVPALDDLPVPVIPDPAHFAPVVTLPQAREMPCLLVLGPPGTGKSFGYRSALGNRPYHVFGGRQTPLQVYLTLHDDPHRPVVLDDISALLRDDQFRDMLKGLCDTGPRVVR